jgi:predicted lipoprotein with Yx(FWY)xxD motif
VTVLRGRTLLPLILAGLFALAIAGCGDDAEPISPAAAPTGATASAVKEAAAAKPAAPPTKKRGQKEITIGSVNPYGKILQDARGRTIYLFTKEKTSRSECYDACADAWPPVLTKRAPFAGKGISDSKLGTTKRSDGSRQVTYNGHPLYYYVGETQADQVLCQAVYEYDGYWYIMNKRGNAITKS